MKKSTVITQLIIFVGIIVVVNLIANKAYFRLDFTEDQRYTLSEPTKDLLGDLDDAVTVTAYFTEDLPPQLLKIKNDFQDLLVEYETRSDGNVVYKFINPNESDELEREAQQKGINPVMVNVNKKDQAQQLRAYLGVNIEKGENREVIPLVQPGAGMEYALTRSIKKLAITDKPSVAFIQGHGEPSVQASMQVVQELSALYNVEPYTITDTAEIPSYYKSLVWIAPKDTIPASHFNKIDRFLDNGGSLFVAYNNLSEDLNSQYLQAKPQIGMIDWLAKKGINLTQNYVIDASCANVTVQQRQGGFTMNIPMSLPYLPIISSFSEDHPVTQGLESVIMPFTCNITYDPIDSATQYTPLAFTSDMSGLSPAPAFINIQKNWQESDFTNPNQVTALAVEGPLAGTGNAKMVVVANGSFALNGEGQQMQQINEDNANLATNAIDWLSDDTGLIALRTKGVTNRPLDNVEDGKKALLKWGNVFAPILMALLLGLIRRQRYMRKRQKWIQGSI
jgi:gliding-associated putative ABC transporter substrate-binding component GldG